VAQGSVLDESSATQATALTAAVAIEKPELAARVADALGAAGIDTDSTAAAANVVIVALDPESRTELARLRELIAQFSAANVLVIAPSLGPAGVRRAVDAGAAGVLPAAEGLESRLPSAVRAAAAGQICVPRSLGLHIARPALSYRERQILGLVVLGFTNGDIAGRLHLAESTVKSHLSSAFAKLGVRSRREAAAMISDADGGLGPGILAISVASPSPPRNGARE
jgi:DNA-binding NarL/FixJ family response regulator